MQHHILDGSGLALLLLLLLFLPVDDRFCAAPSIDSFNHPAVIEGSRGFNQNRGGRSISKIRGARGRIDHDSATQHSYFVVQAEPEELTEVTLRILVDAPLWTAHQ